MPEITQEISINIEVYCANCGEGLCNQTDVKITRNRGEQSFRVTPCEKCLEEAKDDGYKSGYDQAEMEFKAEGQQ